MICLLAVFTKMCSQVVKAMQTLQIFSLSTGVGTIRKIVVSSNKIIFNTHSRHSSFQFGFSHFSWTPVRNFSFPNSTLTNASFVPKNKSTVKPDWPQDADKKSKSLTIKMLNYRSSWEFSHSKSQHRAWKYFALLFNDVSQLLISDKEFNKNSIHTIFSFEFETPGSLN